MSTSVISAKEAMNLNHEVVKKIDSRLFLCCNYEPTISHVFGEDALFHLAIQDLYKFVYDSSCVIKNFRILLPKAEVYQFKNMTTILDYVSDFRTVFDHNTSELNGRIEKRMLESYSAWIYSIIGKTEPESIEDYKALNKQLAVYASELLNSLTLFIDVVSKGSHKAEAVNSWITMTLYWYSHNTKTDIYIGQLQDAYIANSVAKGNDYPGLYKKPEIWRKCKKWLEAALYYPIDREIEQNKKQMESCKMALNGDSPFSKALRSKMKPEEIKAMDCKLQNEIDALIIKIQEGKSKRDDMKQAIGDDCIKYFFSILENRLRMTMSRLESTGIAYTLLPQDLIQEDIDSLVNGVPSPESDF